LLQNLEVVIELEKTLNVDKPYHIKEELTKKLIDSAKGSLTCDGCGFAINNTRIATLYKGHPTNPLGRMAVLHIVGSAQRCKIRICSACGTQVLQNSTVNCGSCHRPIERNTTEFLWFKGES